MEIHEVRRTDPRAGGPVDPRARPQHGGRPRGAARPDARRCPPPPRPPDRRGRRRGPRAAGLRHPGTGPPRQGLRDHRGGPRPVRPAVRRPGRPGAPVPGGDRRGRRRPRLRPPPRRGNSSSATTRLSPRSPDWSRRRRWPGRSPRAATPRRSARGRSGEQLCQQHCPVSHVAHEFPQLCEAETEVISKVLGRHVQRLATIAHGDGVCTTCIPSTSTPRGLLS